MDISMGGHLFSGKEDDELEDANEQNGALKVEGMGDEVQEK